VLENQSNILIKPNLVNSTPFPVTTRPECCAAIIEYCRDHSDVEIILAEGTGDASRDTDYMFKVLGYTKLAADMQISLVDLNTSPVKKCENPGFDRFPVMYLPEIAFSHYIISVPVLKAHSLAQITGTLKNMMGFAPPQYYGGRFGSWKKAVFHKDMQQSIIDLNQYRTPDLTLLDATVGMPDFHLGGRTCDPPVNKLIAGYNPVAVDRNAANLLDINWKNIKHLSDVQYNQSAVEVS
jgi:uncharacterized protein (DUF362 family)